MKLFAYELKVSLKKCLLLFAVLCLVLLCFFGIIFGILRADEEQGSEIRTVFGIVVNDNEEAAWKQMIGFTNTLSGINKICRIELFEENEAFEKLDNDEIQMLMIVPEGFMDKAVHMEETEFVVYTNKSLTLVQYKLLALFGAVERVMRNTESSILAMYEGMDRYEFTMSYAEMENAMMEICISNLLIRDDCYTKIEVSPYGGHSLFSFYGATIIIVFVFLCATPLLTLYGEEERMLERIFYMGKWGSIKGALFKLGRNVITIMAMVTIILIGIFPVYKSFGGYLRNPWEMCLSVLFFSILMGSIIQIIGTLSKNMAESIIIYLLIMFLMSVLSGIFVSVYYLPDIFRRISSVWLLSTWHGYILQIWDGVRAGGLFFRNACVSTIFGVLSILLYSNRLRTSN